MAMVFFLHIVNKVCRLFKHTYFKAWKRFYDLLNQIFVRQASKFKERFQDVFLQRYHKQT